MGESMKIAVKNPSPLLSGSGDICGARTAGLISPSPGPGGGKKG